MKRIEQFIADAARRFSDRIAVDAPTGSFTYAELEETSRRFARVLLDSGVGPGDRVGIHLPRSGKTIAAMLGTLRVGAAYAPLDPARLPRV